MNRNFLARLMVLGIAAAAALVIAAPAHAQTGALKGKVVDEAGKPVEAADLSFDYVGEYNLNFKSKTNAKGEFIQAGLYAVGGRWKVTAKKGDLIGTATGLQITSKGVETVPDIVLKAKSGAAAGSSSSINLPTGAGTKEEIAKRTAEMQKLLVDIDTAIAAKNYDEAITKLTTLTTEIPTCASCFAKLGDVYMQKPDMDGAEKAFLKATELDPKAADPFDALARLYNQTKKFDQAAKMSQKASELHGSAPGGGDANSTFNAGVILWNQGKIADAKAQFERALALNPNMADAQYFVGMALVNEGKLDDAKKALAQYLKLAPGGSHADEAKGVLDALK